MSKLEDEVEKGKKNEDDGVKTRSRWRLRSRAERMDDILNEVVELDEDDLMDKAVMRDIGEKCSTPEDVLLNTRDSVITFDFLIF